jgi:hypothetical protein
MKTGISGALSTFAFVLVLSATGPAWAQERVGVVTTVIGPVTVARASLQPEPLKFKDDVFVHDRVTTGEDAITRILLGGKVIVTARERSTLTITEVPGLSTIHLTSGRIAVAVEKSLMKPGERVDIQTPHAVAGVRGTVLIVEAQPSTSIVTVLRGLVHVTRLNSVSGLPIGGFTSVAARQAVTIRNNVLPARAHAITPHRAGELAQQFTPPLKAVTLAVTSAAAVAPADELKQARDVSKPDASARNSDVDKRSPASVASGDSAVTGTPGPAATAAPTPATGGATASAPSTTPTASASSAAAVVTAPTVAKTPSTVVTAPATGSSGKTNVSNLGASWPQPSSGKRGKDEVRLDGGKR